MLDIIPRLSYHTHIGNVLATLSPWQQFRVWWDNRRMDNYLLPLLRDRIAMLSKESEPSSEKPIQGDKGNKIRTAIDILVRAMADDREDERTFLPYALAETKHTMFAGHETTAFSLAWIFHMLASHRDVMDKVRAEHECVLGPDPAASLRASPHLLSQLAYTSAVIKEMMRVHTNVGTMREGVAGFRLYGPAGSGFEGVAFPTEGCVVWDGTFAIHRNATLWPRPTEFVPERWLTTDPEDPLHPPRNAYRPFEQGPRSCVGQHLAMTEMKMVVALVVRELELETAWDEWDAQRYAYASRTMFLCDPG